MSWFMRASEGGHEELSANRRSVTFGPFIPWVAISAFGWAVASILSLIVASISYAPFINPLLYILILSEFGQSTTGQLLTQVMAGLTGGLLGGAVAGLIVAFAQRAVVRRQFTSVEGWILPTTINWALAYGAMMMAAWPTALRGDNVFLGRLVAILLGSIAGGISSRGQGKMLQTGGNLANRWVPVMFLGWALALPAVLPPQIASELEVALYWIAGALGLGITTGLSIRRILPELSREGKPPERNE